MYIKRILEGKIREYMDKREIIAVVGPRQSGKTTLLKEIFKDLKNAVFLDFEDRDTINLFNEDIKSFIELYVKNHDYLFIDEFQYAKEGGKNLKYADAEKLPFKDKSFNTVISVTAFHNIKNMEKALKEAIRVSKNSNICISFLKRSKRLNEFSKLFSKYFKNYKEIEEEKDIIFINKNKVAQLRILKQITSKSKLTEKDALELGRKINNSLHKRYTN